MRRLSLLVLWVVTAGALVPATEKLIAAEGSPTAEEVLTEQDFLGSLEEAHPASRALGGDLGVAEAERLQAGLLQDPRLAWEREEPDGEARETTWGVAWSPPLDTRRRWAIRAADSGVETQRYVLDSRLGRQRVEARSVYAEWAGNYVRVSFIAGHASTLETLARRTRNRAEAGEVSNLEARRLEIALDITTITLSKTRAAVAASRERAAAWMLGSGEDLLELRPARPALPEVPGELNEEVAWEARPDVRAARARVEQSESLEQLSRRSLEAPEFLLGWKRIEEQGSDLEGPVFAIGWKVPILDRRRADRLEAEATLAAAVAGEEWMQLQARRELAAAFAAYEELRGTALAIDSGLEGLDDLTRAATAAFEHGETNVTDLLDTLQSVLTARLSALDIYLAALDAHRRLEFAAGRGLTSGDRS